MGAFKRRSQTRTPIVSSTTTNSLPSLVLPTLPSYLQVMDPLFSLILQIPPVDPSTSLRITFLLRLTGDVLSSIPGYPIADGEKDTNTVEVLKQLLEFLDDLDGAWVVVLRGEVWDAQSRAGRDLIVSVDGLVGGDDEMQVDEPNAKANGISKSRKRKAIKSTPMSQTERTRLRSLLVGGTSMLEEWLSSCFGSNADDDLEAGLERAGLQQGFDELFEVTLSEMGGLSGDVGMSLPGGMSGTC